MAKLIDENKDLTGFNLLFTSSTLKTFDGMKCKAIEGSETKSKDMVRVLFEDGRQVLATYTELTYVADGSPFKGL